jgi:hypothetical protein
MSNNKQQTAVEWLVDNLHYLHSTKWDDIVERAKAMEKEQIIEAYQQGVTDEYGDTIMFTTEGEDYYNQTYGDEKQ